MDNINILETNTKEMINENAFDFFSVVSAVMIPIFLQLLGSIQTWSFLCIAINLFLISTGICFDFYTLIILLEVNEVIILFYVPLNDFSMFRILFMVSLAFVFPRMKKNKKEAHPPKISETFSFQEQDCPICLEKLVPPVCETSCKHQFHKECIDRWLEKSFQCPMCRRLV
jgi:hypothetical protein